MVLNITIATLYSKYLYNIKRNACKAVLYDEDNN